MTKEQYLNKKEELKQLAANLRYLKNEYKQCQREGCDRAGWSTEKGKRYSQTCRDLNTSYFNYRSGHIFMSLVRGKSRIKIENTFDKQNPHDSNIFTIEERIKSLCEKYDFEMDCDEHGRVISIKQRINLEEKIGA